MNKLKLYSLGEDIHVEINEKIEILFISGGYPYPLIIKTKIVKLLALP